MVVKFLSLFVRACFQISDGSSFGVREFLEEFLSKWNCVDEQYYGLVGAEANVDCMARFERHFILGVDEYVEVVEVYAVMLLATVLQDMHLAISWVEKAALPEEKRQVYMCVYIYIYYVVHLSWNQAFTLYYNQLRLFLDLAVHVLFKNLLIL